MYRDINISHLTCIILPLPPNHGGHNQGLLTGRRENLGIRLPYLHVLGLPWICSVIDHRWHQNVVKKEVAHEPQASVSLMFLPHFDVLCDLLLHRPTATWNALNFVLYMPWSEKKKRPIHTYLPCTAWLFEDFC